LRLVLASAQSARRGGRNIILNALDLRHRTAREVMRPRQEITVFNTAATIAECLALAEKTRYSRFPLCDDGDLDKTRGVVPHQRCLYALRDKAQTAADLLRVARKLIYVPETARLEKLLQLFLERKCTSPSSWTNTAARLASSRWKTRSKRSSARFRTNLIPRNPSWSAGRRKCLGSRRHAAAARTGKNHRRSAARRKRHDRERLADAKARRISEGRRRA
jgi:hypothetical protein